jgi:hypothetical protein
MRTFARRALSLQQQQGDDDLHVLSTNRNHANAVQNSGDGGAVVVSLAPQERLIDDASGVSRVRISGSFPTCLFF